MTDKSEYEKKDLILGMNVFDEAAEATSVDAWIRLVTTLLFMKKGQYPTNPEMGCDLGQYEFAFVDDVVDDIEENINSQIQTYLPDIPFNGATVSTKEVSGRTEPVLIIYLNFTYNDNDDTAVVAAEKVNNEVNFEVAI